MQQQVFLEFCARIESHILLFFVPTWKNETDSFLLVFCARMGFHHYEIDKVIVVSTVQVL